MERRCGMKKLFPFFFLLLLLIPNVYATKNSNSYQFSDWAHLDIEKALMLGITPMPYDGDLRLPIKRGDFAEKATSLVAIEFGSDLESYLQIMSYRNQAMTSDSSYSHRSALNIAVELGILKGRQDGQLDLDSFITRQEAAVMLARTYRAYQDNVQNIIVKPHSFSDQINIADWAKNDVQLMNQLGIMTGLEDNRFDPLGSYTIEQCLVTLVRLDEKAPAQSSSRENPFTIPEWEGGFAQNWENGPWVFAFETETYYIGCWPTEAALANQWYYIEIIDQNLYRRSYHTVIITHSNYYRGEVYARPENAFVTDDGEKLIYTATVDGDVYYTDKDGQPAPIPIQRKGIYTVTMDLKTGEQTYTRADLNKNSS